jgi:hypothetical protein
MIYPGVYDTEVFCELVLQLMVRVTLANAKRFIAQFQQFVALLAETFENCAGHVNLSHKQSNEQWNKKFRA